MANINIRNKIASDATSNSGVKATVSNFTWSHTVGSLTRGLLIVGVAARGAASNGNLAITGITYNGVALTKAVSTNSGDSPASHTLEAEVWYLKNPASGANTISVTFTGTVNHAAGYALSLSQIDQANPLDATGSNHVLGQASPVSNNVTINNDNGWAFDVIYHKIGTSLTPGASQTRTSTELFPNGGGDTADSSYKGPVTPAAATAMAWTYTGTDDYAQALASFTPAPIQDSISVAESVTVSIPATTLSVNVSDSITVSESIVRRLDSNINVSDSIAVSESTNVALAHQINASDSISVSESITKSITGLSCGNLTRGSSTVDGTVYTTDSITPAANALLLLTIESRASAVQPTIASISGNGLTWVEIDHVDNDNSGSRRTIHLYRAMGASPSAGAVTITFNDTQTACTWNIDQITGADTSGTNGSGAIVQFADNVNRGATQTSLTATLAAFSNVNNGTYVAFGTGSVGTSIVAGTDFSTISYIQETTESTASLFTEWKNVNDTSADVSFSADTENGIIAVEIKYFSNDINISVSDSITLSESINRLLDANVTTSDSISLSESIKTELNSNINKSESISVSDAPIVSYPLMQTLRDDFEFAYLDDIKWSNFGGGQVVVANKRLELNSTTSPNYYGITSGMAFNLTSSYAFSQLVNAGNQSLASWEVYPIHLSKGSDAISIMVSGGTVYARKKISGASSTVGATVSYNSTTMQWFRIRESGGTTYWEYAQDPTSTWTEIASVANPIAVTALNGEVIIGTWDTEASTTSAYVDNFNLTPGQLQFSWKGYTWNKRVHLGDSMFNDQWDPANVSGPDGSDYITLSLTNPTGDNPVGAEFFTDQRGFGYGTYTTVIGTRLDTLHGAIVFGGLFTFDFTAPPAYREIDVDETYKYNGSSTVRLLHSHVYDNGGSRAFITDDVDIPSDQVQTHRIVWEPGKITFDSFVGSGTGGSVIAHHEHTTNIPTPGNERAHFNLWVANQNSPKGATPTDVVIRDFTFVASEQISTSDSISISENTNVALAHQINVSDSISVSESVNNSLVILPRVSDSISLSESIAVNADNALSVSVSDSISVSESVKICEESLIRVSDSVSVSESINTTLVHQIAVSDSVAVSESITISELIFVSVSDSISVAESITPDLTISVQSPALIYYQPFGQTAIPPNWQEFGNGTWTYTGSTLTQSAVGNGDPQKVLYTGDSSPLERVVQALVTFDTLNSGTDNRGGITIIANNTNARGYNLVLRGNNSLSFLNDLIAWGPSTSISPVQGESWWLKAMYLGGVFYGKAWKNGTTEPGWMITWTQTPDVSFVYSGITGNSSSNTAKYSYDEFSYYGIPDGVIVSESVSASRQQAATLSISVSDNISTTESVSASEVSFISVSDSISVGEAVNVALANQVNVNDSIGVSESVNVALVHQVSVNDSVGVNESTSVNETIEIVVSDSISIAEAVEASRNLLVSVSDSIIVSENILASVSDPQINVSDAISVTDTSNVSLVHQIAVSDNISITESINRVLVSDIVVSDSISVSESSNIALVSLPFVSDSITISENVQVSLTLEISVSDSIGVTESIKVSPEFGISISDAVSVAESTTVDLAIFARATENISVAESVTIFTDKLYLSVSDTIAVSDQPNLAFAHFISVSDAISVSESVSLTEPHVVEYINKKLIFVDGRLAYLIVDAQGIPHYTFI